jgi:hypothetical protein
VDGDDVYVAVTGAEDEMLEGHISRHRLGAPEQKIASSQQLPRGIAVDAASSASWVGAVFVATAGFVAFRATWRVVAAAWTLAEEQSRAVKGTSSS